LLAVSVPAAIGVTSWLPLLCHCHRRRHHCRRHCRHCHRCCCHHRISPPRRRPCRCPRRRRHHH
jgi:hypothetical protein